MSGSCDFEKLSAAFAEIASVTQKVEELAQGQSHEFCKQFRIAIYDVLCAGADGSITHEDRDFFRNTLFFAITSNGDEILRNAVLARKKLNDGEKLTQREASLLLEQLQAKDFSKVDLDISGYRFPQIQDLEGISPESLDLTNLKVGGKLNLSGVKIDGDLNLTGAQAREIEKSGLEVTGDVIGMPF